MANLLTRKYTYTAQSAKKLMSTFKAIKLSSFSVSGDMQQISQLVSISVRYRTHQQTTYTTSYSAQLIFGDGTPQRVSDKVSKLGYDKHFDITNTFTSMPPVEAFTPDNVSIKLAASVKPNEIYWYGTPDEPLVITVTYYSSEFKPTISGIRAYRANEAGAALDKGTHLTFEAVLAVEKTGASGSGSLKLYKVSAADSSVSNGTMIFREDKIPVSTEGYKVSAAPLSEYSLMIGEAYHLKFVFEYAAITDAGVESTEVVESSVIVVNRVFTNFHLAGVPTGGACFGGYSTATPDHPKLESHFPAYLYGGIANIQTGAVAALGATTGGEYQDGSVTFPIAFANGTTPFVIIGFRSSSTSGTFGRCSVSVLSATNTGFTFRFFNGDSTNRNPDYTYIAFGIPE